MIAVFAVLSVFPQWLTVLTVIILILFFALVIIHYIQLGFSMDSNNLLRDSTDKAKEYLILNIMVRLINGA